MKYVKGTKGKSKKSVNRPFRKTNSVSKTVKRYVKSAIHRQLENKKYNIEIAETLAGSGNATTFQAGNIYQLTPSSATNATYTIIQGTGQGARVGNKINVRSAMFRYAMYPLAYNSISNPTPKPLDVVIYIFSVRRGVIGNTVLDAWNIFNTNFFANGSSSNGTTNNLYDLVSVANEEVVQLHYKKIIKLAANSNILQTGGNASFANNDYKYNAIGKINVGKYLPKTIIFNDDSNNSTSKQVFMIISPYYADGTTIASTTFPLAMFSGLDLVYEDA